MTRRIETASALLVYALVSGCTGTAEDVVGTATEPRAAVAVDNLPLLLPPAGFPVLDHVMVTATTRGRSKIKRRSDGAEATVKLKDLTPGHVLVLATIVFNHPEHCVEGEDRLPTPGPCTANGPADPRDGGIPEVGFSADAWAHTTVDDNGTARFNVDFGEAAPTWSSPANTGSGIENPEGAVVVVYVQDKGPLAEAGPLREAQVRTLFGGCGGPPAFGPLTCTGVGVAQHLP